VSGDCCEYPLMHTCCCTYASMRQRIAPESGRKTGRRVDLNVSRCSSTVTCDEPSGFWRPAVACSARRSGQKQLIVVRKIRQGRCALGTPDENLPPQVSAGSQYKTPRQAQKPRGSGCPATTHAAAIAGALPDAARRVTASARSRYLVRPSIVADRARRFGEPAVCDGWPCSCRRGS
jgi:hypothetical protein